MHKYIVSIEGNDSNKKHFIETVEVEAENEDKAKIKANEKFMKPGPDGISFKYDNGPDAVVHWIVGATKRS